MIKDDASDWFASQGQEIQDYEVPPLPEVEPAEIIDDADVDRPYGDTPEVTNDDVRNVMNLRAVSKPTAEVVVGTLDVVLPLVLAWIIKGADRDELHFSPEERDTLVEAWANYLAEKNVQVSPGMALIVSMLTVCGGKVAVALASRKANEELEQLRREKEETEARMRQAAAEAESLKKQIAAQRQKGEQP